MKKATVLALALIFISSAAFADVGWKDADGKPVADSDSQKTVEGFGALVNVTSDQGWDKKLNKPPGVAPQFAGSSIVKTGGELFILTMFTNPQLDDAGKANVTVDIDVKRPNGSGSTHIEKAVCFEGALEGAPLNVQRCGPVVGFVGEASDPVGTWTVQVTLTDNNRKVAIPLTTTFEVVK